MMMSFNLFAVAASAVVVAGSDTASSNLRGLPSRMLQMNETDFPEVTHVEISETRVEDPVVIVVGDDEEAVDANEEEYGFACQTFEQLICGEDYLSIMCTFLFETYPDIGQMLEKGEYTAFIPTDSAFDAIEDILDDMKDSQLERIFKYHFAEGLYFPWDLTCTERLAMTSGDDSRTRCEKGEDGEITKYQKGNGNYNYGLLPQIEYPSMRTCTGIIHVVDLVMLPTGGKTTDEIIEAEAEALDIVEEDATIAPSGNFTEAGTPPSTA